MKLLIAESEHFSQRAIRVLQPVFDVTLADLDRDGLAKSLSDVEVLWVRLRNQIDNQLLASAPKLKYIVTNATGLNHIDERAASSHGVTIVSLKGEEEFLRDIRATAEFAVGLAIAIMRRVPAAHEHVCDGGWNRYQFRGGELYGRTVGIIGYGRLGRIVGKYFSAFDMKVVACDTREKDLTPEHGVEFVSLDELLSLSHLISLHASYSTGNVHMIGTQQFRRMRPGTYFVNTSRGGLVDEAALLRALQDGVIAGAALDVLAGEGEGVPQTPLTEYARTHDNLIITPHIGGNTSESSEMTEYFLARKLVDLDITAEL